MKPHWDSLMSSYADSKSVLIADVDCTASGKSLCEKHGIQGYPTLKYGEPSALKDYEGGRTLKDFEKFADEHLGPSCGPDNLDLCDAVDKKFIEKFKKWDIDELDMSIEEKEAKVKKIEDEGKKVVGKANKVVDKLQEQIEKEGKKKDKAIEKAKTEANYGQLKAVKASRSPKEEKKEEL